MAVEILAETLENIKHYMTRIPEAGIIRSVLADSSLPLQWKRTREVY
jgi:hypothetical protein